MFISAVEVSKAVAWLIVLAPYVLAGAVFVAKAALKTHFDRRLEAFGAENRTQLAAIQAGHQRLVHESGLYARDKHRAYARVFRKMRIATDSYSALIGLTSTPDYSKYDVERVRECLADWKVDERDAVDVLEAYSGVSDYRNRQKAGQLMGKLDREVRRQRAERARIQFVNAEVLDSLYLTDAVQAKLNVVRDLLGGFSVDLRFLGEEPPKVPLMEQRRAIREAAEAAHNTMRQELKRGDAAAVLGPLATPTGSAEVARERVPNDLAGL
jgi:hypothetical protein